MRKDVAMSIRSPVLYPMVPKFHWPPLYQRVLRVVAQWHFHLVVCRIPVPDNCHNLAKFEIHDRDKLQHVAEPSDHCHMVLTASGVCNIRGCRQTLCGHTAPCLPPYSSVSSSSSASALGTIMDKEPGKSADAHRVDRSAYLADSDTMFASKATTVSNTNLNANNITGGVGMLVNNSQIINNVITGSIPKESVRSNHLM